MSKRTLSQDIRLLGDTLGLVIKQQGGAPLFEAVESMRSAAKQARSAHSDPEREHAASKLSRITGGLGGAEALDVSRAFTLYFQLINLAEDIQHSRELRERALAQGEESLAESYFALVRSLAEQGVSLEEMIAYIRDLDICFVFTAHPTEARRRTTERLLAQAREVLEDLDRRELIPNETRRAERRLEATIEALWQHAAERAKRPDVLDEVKAGLWYIRHVLLDVIPKLQRRLHHALSEAYGPLDALEVPPIVRFGSWMGSDRDGNPFVTDEVTAKTLELQRFIAIDRYLKDLDALIDPLAAAASRLRDHAALSAARARAEDALPELALSAAARNPEEPLRHVVTLMRVRLERTLSESGGAYASASEFMDDLIALRETLLATGARALPNDLLLDLIYRARAFGFSLAALDVREDSRAHQRAIAELLGDPDYATRSDAERLAALERLKVPESWETLTPETERVLSCFASIADLQRRFGASALPTYAISTTESSVDVIEVLTFATHFGIRDSIDIVPLLEDPSTLARAREILGALYTHPAYVQHLETRGKVQELLVGYSDSMKQGGMLASRVRVLEAQRAAVALSRDHGITLRVFHGRGGSVSRGGGPTYRAIDAMPRDTITAAVKFTEQGEVRAYHFAESDLATRYIEQTVGAQLKAYHESKHDRFAPWQQESELLARLAGTSLRAYRDLIDDPEVLVYYAEATPLDQVTSLNIASRPSKRREGALRLADLRAIPWVFAWAQSRHVITGWYGVGAALASFDKDDDRAFLQEAYLRSAFFRDIIDNVAMTLAKADMGIAGRYAALCEDAALAHRVFERIANAYRETSLEVLNLSDSTALLDHDRRLQASIRRRNPYVDPLSYLQLEALRRLRAAEPPADLVEWKRVGRVTVHGIAAGMRNTG